MKVDRVGEKHITNEGYKTEIIEYFGALNCTVMFEEKFILKNIQYGHIVRGKVKNPYHKSVFGVGYLGVGGYGSLTSPKIYQTWTNMLTRCYDLRYQERYLTYKSCSVDKCWHNFQNFAEWFEKKNKDYMQGWALDKDILQKGNKIYSPETCCFVPAEINNLVIKSNCSRGKYPIGVYKVKSKFRASFNINGKTIHLGLFDTPEEAFQVYKITKEKYIREIADKYKNQITEQVYRALINYKIEITD